MRGRWMKGPGADFFDAVRTGARPRCRSSPRTSARSRPRSYALRDRFGLPGIKILQFAFGDDPPRPRFLPHNYPRRAVVYTGTHDNDTVVGWFRDQGGRTARARRRRRAREREAALRYLGDRRARRSTGT